jgi:hypothetical protein
MGDKGFESSGLESYLQCAKQEEEQFEKVITLYEKVLGLCSS